MNAILEQWRKEKGAQFVSEKGVPCTVRELKGFICGQDTALEQAYKVAGGSVSVCGMSIELKQGAFVIRRMGNDIISIDKSDGPSGYENITHIDFERLKQIEAREDNFMCRICYSSCDWIDVQFGFQYPEGTEERQNWSALFTLTLRPNN